MATKSQPQKKDYLLVAALDFGTTYSGYAFSTRGDFIKDPVKISSNQAWVSGGKYLLSQKTPTCLLLDKKKDFVSFGYDAENEYADLVLDGKQKDYYYFQRFKMKLHGQKITKDLLLEDVSGKPVQALIVFSLSIAALKEHLLETIGKQGTGILNHEIEWILTVPAIWTDSAKQFMREAAEMAGIPPKQLKLALEPEAASIFCQYLPMDRLSSTAKGFSVSRPGTKYMVIDLGGGTADITVHEKLEGGKLKELFKASGGACGGTAVDSQFFQLLAKIVGAPLLKIMEKEHTASYMDLFRDFENVKRTVKTESKGKINMSIPIFSLNPLCEELLGEDFLSAIENSTLCEQFCVLGDKLRINVETIFDIFKPVIDDIVSHVKAIMSKPEARGVSIFLLVGGFSESKLVQQAIAKAFPGTRLIVPDEPGLAVLKGAVIFGHRPDTISSRIIQYSYGVEIMPAFIEGKHPESKKVNSGGRLACVNVFSCFMKAGTSAPVGKKVVDLYSTTRPFQDIMSVKVYYSRDENPEYTTDGCELLGEVEVSVPNPSEDMHNLAVEYTFGDTELSLLAIESHSMSVCKHTFEMI